MRKLDRKEMKKVVGGGCNSTCGSSSSTNCTNNS